MIYANIFGFLIGLKPYFLADTFPLVKNFKNVDFLKSYRKNIYFYVLLSKTLCFYNVSPKHIRKFQTNLK